MNPNNDHNKSSTPGRTRSRGERARGSDATTLHNDDTAQPEFDVLPWRPLTNAAARDLHDALRRDVGVRARVRARAEHVAALVEPEQPRDFRVVQR